MVSGSVVSGNMGSGKRLLILLTALVFAQAAWAFDYSDVVERARERAASAWSAPKPVPDFLRNLDYSEFQAIRFRPEASLWRDSASPFQVMLMSPGSYYGHAVRLNVVDGDRVSTVSFDKSVFDYPGPELAKRIPADLGYAGFKLTFPLHDKDTANQFLVFGGASYFRGVGRDNRFGLSARGLAVDTGLPSGEEVPAFTDFWLEKPAAGSESMRVYALLDGPRVTGAYRFDIQPGAATEVRVKAELFFRDNIQQPGIAPLTSMFYYGENTPRPVGEWRPQVHDSDGLLLHDSHSGEWLWRPLLNPANLRLSYFSVTGLGGFGLLQRDTGFDRFEDAEARYDQRPSAWVRTEGDWGPGHVVLVEIPTRGETNDNIVAFWKPQGEVRGGEQRTFEYTLTFGNPAIAGEPLAYARNTFVGLGDRVGGGNVAGAIRLIVDFAGGPLEGLAADAPVVSQVTGLEDTEVIEHFVEYLPSSDSWRLSILARPQGEKVLALRGFLSQDGRALTETWNYELPHGSDLRGETE